MGKQASLEQKVKNRLIDEGHHVVRSAGSFGCWDLIAWKLGGALRLIQVKKTQGPRAEERKALQVFPPFCCPHCQREISSKEIWLYKIKDGVMQEVKIEYLDPRGAASQKT